MLKRTKEKLNAFLRGMGSVLNICPNPRQDHRIRKILDRTDEEALAGDWEKVGQDLQKAMGKMDEELKK